MGFAAYRPLSPYYDLILAVQVLLICLGPAKPFSPGTCPFFDLGKSKQTFVEA